MNSAINLPNGLLPNGWVIATLEEIATLQRGIDLPLQDRIVGDVPVYGSNGIDGYHDTTPLKGPGVITGRSGSIGFLHYQRGPYWPLNTTLYVKHFHGNHEYFVYYLLQIIELKKYAASTGVPSLNRNFVHPLRLAISPLPEQKKIARILTTVDDLIEQTEALIEKYKSIKQGIMHDLFTRGVDSTGKLRPPYEHAPHLYKQSSLGWIPKEWEVCRVDEMGMVKLGRQRSPKYQSGRFTTPYLRVANVFDEWIDYSDVLSMDFTPNERETFSLVPGDILLNEGQSLELVGRSATYLGEPYRFCFQNTLIRFRTFDTNIHGYCQSVFKYWLDCGKFMTIALQTTSIAHLGAGRFAKFLMKKPPTNEQRTIAAVLTSHINKSRNEDEHLKKLHTLKTGLMQDLLTGKVRVNVDEANKELTNA